MNLELSEEATEYAEQASRAFATAGGDSLVQRAEYEPDRRGGLVEPVLTGLGAWDLEARSNPIELEAAAALCRSAGYWALAYPVAERLARPVDLAVDGLLVVAGPVPSAAVAHLDLRWAAVTLDGNRSSARATPATRPPRTSLFVSELELDPIDDDGAKDVALALTLPGWTLLGMLDRAIDLARAHVRLRTQFGRPLSAFQAVQFQLADAEVERMGVEALAKHALWSVQTESEDALADALALRIAAAESAETVFRAAHQLHGASGFCDETTLSWLSRYSQPLRRLPLGLSAARERLTRLVGRRGLTGLFGEPLGEPLDVSPV
ncbi:acyl-CoA dehydrogenase family protein [Cryptosporangium aurantiacum]|uniref:Acyl-CoA dehydrogenase, C-terminal domain n=1 Tax=Cryptosporangium aurantiacum TaxID=134849 RepID=A0A1M7KN81_9ACTN|nr:acyl-CoA dehydrogenase family protein [Cryptosporangium aurantiacum]SHM66431.1 Acyl-CoA dehydrogenase, C-terminal domain [Cryptosporangium aurantiacum]